MDHNSQDPADRAERIPLQIGSDLDREVADAYLAGGFTAVLELAQRHQTRLQHEWADLTRDVQLRYVCAADRTEPPSPLEIQLGALRHEMADWDHVANHARPLAAEEAFGWTILPDGNSAKMLPNGQVISTTSSVRYEEPDGTIVDTAPGPAERQRHRRHLQDFASRVCRERLARARSAHATFTLRGVRPLARRRGAGRPRAQAVRSSAASGDGGDDGPGEPEPGLEARPARSQRAVVVPRAIRRYVAGNGLTIRQVRWCDFCGMVAPAVDDYQRQALDRVGFTTLCPDCEGER